MTIWNSLQQLRLNSNIGCFEISNLSVYNAPVVLLNSNIGCFEINDSQITDRYGES